MKKQFHKIIIAAENLSRSNRIENKNDELVKVEKQVDKYKDVLEKICKKFSPSSAGSDQDKEKRIKKIHEFRLGQALEESAKELPTDLVLHDVLVKSGDLEKKIANFIVENEIQTENDVTKKLKNILDINIPAISSNKRSVSRFLTEYNSNKRTHENAQRSSENAAKLNQLKSEQEESESQLEKYKDFWAAEMFELIAKDEVIAYCIRDYLRNQKTYYEEALRHTKTVLDDIDEIIDKCRKKKVFGVALQEHLRSTSREISSVIELCCCCLLERGICEEGLLRVGCANSKLKRMKNAIDAHYAIAPLSQEYQDVHVIASVLKSYLRELPEPLLTFGLFEDFIKAAQRPSESERKSAIKNAVNQLPKENYDNLKYLTKFLWHLYQRSEVNKMSSQNIAIVMSPNILWPPETMLSQDYACQVNSSAAVNTIVELLISEWDFFFNGADLEFFQTLSKDGLFLDPQSSGGMTNSGFGANGDYGGQILTEAIYQQQQQQQQSKDQKYVKQTHSRSSSHDTSRINLGAQDNSSLGRSHSNDSLSDTSPSHTGSPKLPARKKHNKPSAPTPPNKMSSSMIAGYNGNHLRDTTNSEQKALESVTQKCDGTSQTPPLVSTSSLDKNKPDKPPRPAGPNTVDCYTLNRSTYKNRSIEKIPAKPTALPRTILNIAKSTENLSIISDDTANTNAGGNITGVLLREKPEIREKPVIPERPVTLMRPTSFRSDNHFNQDFLKNNLENSNSPDNIRNSNGNSSSGTNIKKASSFRMMSCGSPGNSAQNISGNNGGSSNRMINSTLANSTSSLCSNSSNQNSTGTTTHNHKTTLERAQFFSVDKKQVAIIDVITTADQSIASNTTITTNASTKTPPTKLFDKSTNLNNTITTAAAATATKEFISVESGAISATNILGTTNTGGNGQQKTSTTPTNNHVPISPRGFNQNIKRPQIPAPAPPTNRRKSDGTLGDSPHL